MSRSIGVRGGNSYGFPTASRSRAQDAWSADRRPPPRAGRTPTRVIRECPNNEPVALRGVAQRAVGQTVCRTGGRRESVACRASARLYRGCSVSEPGCSLNCRRFGLPPRGTLRDAAAAWASPQLSAITRPMGVGRRFCGLVDGLSGKPRPLHPSGVGGRGARPRLGGWRWCGGRNARRDGGFLSSLMLAGRATPGPVWDFQAGRAGVKAACVCRPGGSTDPHNAWEHARAIRGRADRHAANVRTAQRYASTRPEWPLPGPVFQMRRSRRELRCALVQGRRASEWRRAAHLAADECSRAGVKVLLARC